MSKWGTVAAIVLLVAMLIVVFTLSGCPKPEEEMPIMEPPMEEPPMEEEEPPPEEEPAEEPADEPAGEAGMEAPDAPGD